jgi:hypothetical protein
MKTFVENGANVGTMGAGTGADIIGARKAIDTTRTLLKKKNKIKVFPMHLKEVKQTDRMNRKWKAETKREKIMKSKHFGEQFTSNPNNNDGGTNNDVIRTAGFSSRVMGAIKAASQRDKQKGPSSYFTKKVEELKKKGILNNKEDTTMGLAAELYNRVILEGRGRPRKDPHDPKWAAHDAEHGEDDEADQNIHFQMKKAAGIEDVHSQLNRPSIEKPVQKQFHEVKYANGTTQKISPRIAKKWLAKHESLKPEGKLQMQQFSQQSHHNLMRAIGEELEEQAIPSLSRDAKCKSCGEGHHSQKGKVMINGYHDQCKNVSHQVKTYAVRQGTIKSEESIDEAFGTAGAVKDRNNPFRHKDSHKGLPFSKDAEPICPSCGHHNAMLHKIGEPNSTFECRDCKHVVTGVHRESIEEGRIADAQSKKQKGALGFHDGKEKKPLDKKALDTYFRNKYKKANGEVVKNEEVLTETPLVDVDKCPTCKRTKGERHVVSTKRPSISKMEKWVSNGVAKATDGCTTEPDGHCQHGHSSWLLRLGLI